MNIGFIKDRSNHGKLIIFHGVFTKGNAVPKYYSLGNLLIVATAERNQDKWG